MVGGVRSAFSSAAPTTRSGLWVRMGSAIRSGGEPSPVSKMISSTKTAPSRNIPKACEGGKSPAVRRLQLLAVIVLAAISIAADQTIAVRGEIADTYCLG